LERESFELEQVVRRFRAKQEHLKWFLRLETESQGQHLAVTVSSAPTLLES